MDKRRYALRWSVVSIGLVAAANVVSVDAVAGAPVERAEAAAGEEHHVATTSTSPTDADSLGPTWQRPWNPPAAMPRRRGWERALLLPGRIVTLPLSGLGIATDRGLLA